jgi:hypothetical protein
MLKQEEIEKIERYIKGLSHDSEKTRTILLPCLIVV